MPVDASGKTLRERLTHYADYDAPGRHTVRALCGLYVRREQHDNEPTCPNCRAGLEYRASRGEDHRPC